MGTAKEKGVRKGGGSVSTMARRGRHRPPVPRGQSTSSKPKPARAKMAMGERRLLRSKGSEAAPSPRMEMARKLRGRPGSDLVTLPNQDTSPRSGSGCSINSKPTRRIMELRTCRPTAAANCTSGPGSNASSTASSSRRGLTNQECTRIRSASFGSSSSTFQSHPKTTLRRGRSARPAPCRRSGWLCSSGPGCSTRRTGPSRSSTRTRTLTSSCSGGYGSSGTTTRSASMAA
mmetsp:Transcript_37357/g.111933  ORF Transcript_37357/g.111933 Transcript_37357/m.111933 type:complete len:232 (+) Transcript_37357:1788-2483(+)